MKIFLKIIALVILLNFLFPQNLFAESKNDTPSITVINLLRGKYLGHEKDNLLSSLKDQWSVTSNLRVNATWLWQYSALEDHQMTDFAKKEMKNQEFGILLEIDRNYAQKSKVEYRGQGPSYFSDGLLLVSYDISERRKLIDSVFAKFKSVFGYYPKTVGAWWIGADSINYMQQKYGITAVLKASDQYNLDVYTIWGTPWSIPYLSSKENEGVPAASYNESSKVVILQWAPRDPVKGYDDSTYSSQDFSLKGYDFSYADYLFNIYLKKPLDNVVLGVENGGNLESFNNFYKKIIEEVNKRQGIRFILAKDYAKTYLDQKQVFAGDSIILAKSFDSEDQVLLINSRNYRAIIEKNEDKIYLSDLRDYSSKEKEDFYSFTNSQGSLWVGEKYLIDSKLFPASKKLIYSSEDSINLKKRGNTTQVFSGKNLIAVFTPDSLKINTTGKDIIYNFKENNLSDSNNTFEINFNKVQILFFYVFPFSIFENLKTSLFFLKWFPLFLLPFIIFFLKDKKILQLVTGLAYLLIYLEIPYFPLNKNSLLAIAVIFSAIFAFLIFSIIFYSYKKQVNKLPAISFLIAFFVVILISCLISRSKEVINPFEVNALQFIKNQNKNVIFVSQQDYSVKPIYKAVRPLIYDYKDMAPKLTGVNWNTVLRPQNHVLNIDNYSDKLIFIPRYLGSDLSKYEIEKLKLVKIFDNYQIAIYRFK